MRWPTFLAWSVLCLSLFVFCSSLLHPVLPPNQVLIRTLLEPVVYVEVPGRCMGSGVILYSRDGHTYICTCAHVVLNGGEPSAKIFVKVFHFPGGTQEECEAPAIVVAYDAEADLALLLTSEDLPGQVAELAREEDLTLFQRIYIVGCQSDQPPMPFPGEIIRTDDLTEMGLSRFRTSASGFFGNSGGAVFGWTRGRWLFIGMPYMLGGMPPMGLPCPQINWSIPPGRIRAFIAQNHFGFLLEGERCRST